MFRRTIFPIPLIYLRVQRDKRKLAFDVPYEATTDDCWNVDGDKSLSESWIGVTRFELLTKNRQEEHLWIQGRLTKKQVPA